jgi:hypothetical protein
LKLLESESIYLNEKDDRAIQYLRKQIEKKILSLKGKIPNNMKSVLNPEKMIDDYKNFLISRIPVILEKSKTGIGGNQFGYECYKKLMELVQKQVNEIPEYQKVALRTLAPKKQEFLNNSKNINLYPFFDTFKSIIDFPFMIGWMDEYKNFEEKMLNYSNQISTWVDRERESITNSVINTVSNFLYQK